MVATVDDAQATALRIVEEVVAPAAQEVDRDGTFPWAQFRALAEAGLLALVVPREYGGSYDGMLPWFQVMEEVGRACGTTGNVIASHSLCAYIIELAGSEEQKAAWLPRLASGELLGAMALTEPGAGSDAAGLKTKAVRDGDEYVVNGYKALIANGGEAHLYAVIVLTDESQGTKGTSALLVEKDTPGLRFGEPYRMMGLHGLSVSDIYFEDCRVPAANRLGQEGEGFKTVMKALDRTRPAVGAMSVGLAQASLDSAVKHATTREQFGKPLAQQQLIQAKLAKMATDIAAARMLVHEVARARDAGVARYSTQSAMAKLFATEIAVRAADEAIQIHGGWGYTDRHPVERYYRDARALTMADGTNEIMHLIIAGSLTR